MQEVMKIDAIRRSFVNINTEWLINNLDKILTSEFINENDDLLTNLHKNLIEQANEENKEKKRIEMKKRAEEEKNKIKKLKLISIIKQ